MTQTEIEAFLAVCRQKNISRAAAELFISQSSLSTRIKILEQEVGCSLFLRRKGSHQVMLTEEGERFYQLSLQYQKIVCDMLAIAKRRKVLRVSAINSVATYLLPPVCERFMNDHPDIHLEIQDMTTAAACKKILREETDLAFTTGLPDAEQIRAEVILREPMILICAAGSRYPDRVGLDMLPVEKEIYVEWDYGFACWHQNLWGVGAVPQIRLEIMSQLQMFVMKKDVWAIVPYSAAKGLAPAGVRWLEPAFPLPDRELYVLQRRASDAESARLFLDCARQLWHEPPCPAG